jgi:hypothetical protein
MWNLRNSTLHRYCKEGSESPLTEYGRIISHFSCVKFNALVLTNTSRLPCSLVRYPDQRTRGKCNPGEVLKRCFPSTRPTLLIETYSSYITVFCFVSESRVRTSRISGTTYLVLAMSRVSPVNKSYALKVYKPSINFHWTLSTASGDAYKR